MAKNPYLKSFIETLDERYPDDSKSLTNSQWLFQHTTLRQKPFSTKDYSFQTEIIDDMNPDLSCIKPSQVGLTESQMRKFFAFLKRNPGTSGIFSFPNQPMRDRMSQSRIKLLLETDKIWNGPLVAKPVRQKALYQVDESFGYIFGTTEGEATSTSADILMEDEVDLANQALRGLMQSRLQNSDHKINQRFSTPTFEGFGIDAAYRASDQRSYLIRCPGCRHWQAPDFKREFLRLPGLPITCQDVTRLSQDEVNQIDISNVAVVCERCSKPLDLRNPSENREWVAKHPGRSGHGYDVRPFSTHRITIPYILDQMMKYNRADNPRGFFNTVLGQPFNDSNARISEADIRQCFLSNEQPVSPAAFGDVFLGADMGETCHVVIGRPNHIFEFHQIPRREIVDFVVGKTNAYNIVAGGIDRYPYTPTSDEIRDKTFGRIMPVGYATVPKAPAVVEQFDEFEQLTHYVVNRTISIDAVANKTRNRVWNFSGHEAQSSLLISHMRGMFRMELPDLPPVWQKVGEDHYLHAMANHQLAVRLKQGIDFQADQRSSIFLGGGARLFTPAGPGIFRGADNASPFGILGGR
jgi:hypothetical protein